MIRVELQSEVAWVKLCRPDKRNALTPDMLGSLETAVRQAAAGPARAVVLCGEGPAFCAGFDLDLCKDHPDGSVMRALLTGLAGVIAALREQPLPVVAALRGAAVAGGCALLGGCDLVVTHDTAKLGYPVTRLGVSPAVSAPTLAAMLGWGPARARLLDVGLVSGREALRLGLAHESVAEDTLVEPKAGEIARALAAKPARAMHATRAWLARVEDLADGPWRALRASLELTGGDEERRLLPAAWAARP